MNATAATLDLRRDLRVDVDAHAVRIETTLALETATIVNISRYGILVLTDAPAEVGAPIVLELPAVGAVEAEIVWAKDGRVGCQFADPIEMLAYAELLIQLPRL